MRLDLKIKGIDAVQQQLARLSGHQSRQAYAAALNDTAHRVRREMQAEMGRIFVNPTPYVAKSPWIFPATADKLSVAIAPTKRRDAPGKGGKAGIDPQQILQAQEQGGPRRDKRSEVALRRVGILPAGYQTARPERPYPGSTTATGDISGAFISHLLSYLQAQGEQGYKQNMLDRTKKRVHTGTKAKAGRRYFVSYGELRSGRTSHLAPGIWAASGTHSVDVRPVLMFVKAASYRPRLNLDAIASRSDLDDYLAKRIRYQIRKAVGE